MKTRPFNIGVVTISLDTELGWARVNSGEYSDVAARLDEGKTAIRRLLGVFDEYDVPATWAIVGQLVSPKEPSAELERLSTIADDIPWERDWWRMPSLVDEIRSASADHEVGSHSGSHLLYDALSPDQARNDIEYFRETITGSSTDPTSFVFPQNRTRNFHVVENCGFDCYRGLAPAVGGTPTPVPFLPRRTVGLINVPLSAGYRHFGGRHPLLRTAPTWSKIEALKLGTWLAAHSGRVFHVALHPNDFTLSDGIGLLEGLEEWLNYVTRLREKGDIEIAPMGRVASRARWPEARDSSTRG